jgi:hypothetical protein
MKALVQKEREYELIIGDWKNGDGLKIQNLQVTFDISKSSNNKDKTNSAAIEIYNLSDESLKVLDTDYPVAVFSAGYKDIGIKQLFAGQVSLVTTRKSGTDRVTQLRLGSGYQELNHQLLNSLTSPGRTLKDVVEDVRTNLPGVSRGVYNGTNLNNQLLYGYPLMGTPKEMLNELSEKYRLDWQIDDDTLYVHDKTRANDENFDQAYIISKYTGLIENAYRTTSEVNKSKKDKAKKQAVQWRMLLNPDIVAGSIVKLEDTLIQGWYKVEDLRHFGGYRDNDWFTEVKAVAIEKVVNTK